MMKLQIFFTLTFFLIIGKAFGQTTDFTINFNENSFEIFTNKKGISKIISNDVEYFLLDDTELPALPYKYVNILLPKNTEIADYNISIETEKLKSDILLINNPQVSPSNSVSAKDTSKKAIKYKEKIYPSKSLSYQTLNKMQGYNFASFKVCPFIYNYKNKELLFINKVHISISASSSKLKSGSVTKQRKTHPNAIKNLIINTQDLESLYPLQSTMLESATPSTDVEYLIVTSDDLAESFLPLKAWKIQKGIRTEIITTSQIYSSYTGSTNQLKIKNCLKDYYENKNLKWVLLGGDNVVVPDQDCYGYVEGSEETYTEYTIPTDLFYACFDYTFNWNYDGDGIIGETEDDIDFYPEVYISRAPVRDVEHVKTFVAKSLYYEKIGPSVNYDRMLLTGNFIYLNWDGKSDAHHKSEHMYMNSILRFGWTLDKDKFYDTGTDFLGGANYDLTATNLSNVLNSEDYHFIHMATHGNYKTWQMESGGSFSSSSYSSHPQNLLNSTPVLINSTSCLSNGFDMAEPCLSEAFIRNPDYGAITYWGSSRYGWSYNYEASGPSFQLSSQFYKNLFYNQNYRFGEVTSSSKASFVHSNYGAFRWLQFSQNAIGDPELSIFIHSPSLFSNITIIQSGTSVTVNTGGVSNCNIALTSVDMGKTYFEVAKNVSSKTFTGVTSSFYITVTKHNYEEHYIPFVFPSDLYIQNISFTEDTYIDNNKVIAGSDVTSLLPQGDVIIESGSNVTMNAYDGITLSSGFRAELGSTFSANIIAEPNKNTSLKSKSLKSEEVNNLETNNSFTDEKISAYIDNVKLFPNPTSTEINVSYTTNKETTLSIDIFDINGCKIETLAKDVKIGSYQYLNTFLVSHLSAGTYFIVFSDSEKRITKTLIKK